MKKRTFVSIGRLAAGFVAAAALAACGGNDKDKKYSIGGTASGLAGTVVLQNNGGDNLNVGASGPFTFGVKVKKDATYAVTVMTQPAGQTCTVANGSGTATGDVTNVAVTCQDNPAYTVGGTVAGLSGSVVLSNAGEDLAVGASGPFTFLNPVRSGLPYGVTVKTQPAGQTCTVTGGSGTVASANVTSVTVACADNPPPPVSYSIGGTVSGLTGGTLQLGLQHSGNMGNSIDVTANGSFDFDPDKVAAGDDYVVTVVSQPAGQTCSVTNGSGTANADVTDIAVTCAATTTDYAVGGTISGLKGSGLRIENGASNSTVVASNATTFTLPNRLGNGATYDLGIWTQPAGQTCLITRAHGAIAGADVTNVLVTCVDNVTSPLVGTYTVPALSSSDTSYVYITLFADGTFIYGSVENTTTCGNINDGNGVEYGVYDYDATTGAFAVKAVVVDTNGGCGVWLNGASQIDGTLAVTGSGQGKVLSLTVPGRGTLDLVPVGSDQIIGSFSDAYRKRFWLFLPAGGNDVYFFIAETQSDTAPTSQGHVAGLEYACGTITGTTANGSLSRDFSASCLAPAPDVDGPVDTNGTSGLSHVTGSWTFAVSGNSLGATTFNGFRVVPN